MQSVTKQTRKPTAAQLTVAFQHLSTPIQQFTPVFTKKEGRHTFDDLKGRGTGLHRALHHFNRYHRRDFVYQPWVNQILRGFSDLGVFSTKTEWRLGDEEDELFGVCDCLFSGGPRPHGVAEIKVCGYALFGPLPHHIYQVGLYAQLIADREQLSPEKIWASVVYANLCTGWLITYRWDDASDLICRTRAIAA